MAFQEKTVQIAIMVKQSEYESLRKLAAKVHRLIPMLKEFSLYHRYSLLLLHIIKCLPVQRSLDFSPHRHIFIHQ